MTFAFKVAALVVVQKLPLVGNRKWIWAEETKKSIKNKPRRREYILPVERFGFDFILYTDGYERQSTIFTAWINYSYAPKKLLRNQYI